MAPNDDTAAPDSLAARTSFVTSIGGYPRTVKKGSVYAADHPIVAGNPTRFGPVNVRERPGTAAAAAVRQAAERPRVVAPPEPPTDAERIAELVRAHRGELDTLARAAGVEKPEDLPNKGAVAEAIIAAVARSAEPATPVVGGLEGGAGHPADATGPATLEDATDEQLVDIAAHYGVALAADDPVDRDATIAAIRAAAGYASGPTGDGAAEPS